jgi:hypothetical protein
VGWTTKASATEVEGEKGPAEAVGAKSTAVAFSLFSLGMGVKSAAVELSVAEEEEVAGLAAGTKTRAVVESDEGGSAVDVPFGGVG